MEAMMKSSVAVVGDWCFYTDEMEDTEAASLAVDGGGMFQSRFGVCDERTGAAIATVWQGADADLSISEDQAAAHAQLIAAAPEMLAALLILFKWFEITGSSVDARWSRIPPVERKAIVDATRAAIKKATSR